MDEKQARLAKLVYGVDLVPIRVTDTGESPLLLQAAEAERAAVVAFLREAGRGLNIAGQAHAWADMIEEGAHLSGDRER